VSGFVVGVDYGTANTVGLLRWPDGKIRPLLFDGSPLLPSAVFVEPDGTGPIVGRDALRSARLDPAGYVPDPKRHLDDGEVAVRGRLVPVVGMIGAAFVRVGQEAIRAAGGAVPRLTVAYPAGWDNHRRAVLTEATVRAGLGVPTLVPAPVAAARWWADRVAGGVQPGRYVLVYDLGAGGCEVSLVRATGKGLEVVATDWFDHVGGLDLDRVFVRTIGAQLMSAAPDAWWQLSVPATTADQRHRLDFLEAVRAAKETLSREPTVALHVPLVEREVSVSREQFERAAEPTIARTAEGAAELLTSAGVAAKELADVLLVGGSTRIPLVADVVRRELGVRPTASEQPELTVAEGLLGTAVPAPDPATVPFAAVVPPGRRRRRGRIVAAAAALAVILVSVGLLLSRGPDTAGGVAGPAAASERPSPSTAGSAGLGSLERIARPPGSVADPTPTTTPSIAPASSALAATSGPPPPVSVLVTVTPSAGSCSTDFAFTAHFTVIDPAKYRWHWVFGGPNGYAYTSGNHDQDKTGQVRMSRKFSAPGAYWGRIEIVSPVSVTSDPAPVQVVC
jgi:hypothetical protein